MSGRDVGTVTKARDLILGNGIKISVDIVCRRCGHEQPTNYLRLRCQRCDGVLKQLASNEHSDRIRSVGGVYKQPSSNKVDMKVTRAEHIRYDKRHAMEEGITYNSFSKTTTRARTPEDIKRLMQIKSRKGKKIGANNESTMGEKYIYPRHLRASNEEIKPPSMTNLRSEAIEVRGNWIKAIALKTGKPYYYNARSKQATWDSTAFDTLFSMEGNKKKGGKM